MKKWNRKRSWTTRSLIALLALAGTLGVGAQDEPVIDGGPVPADNPHIDDENEADWGEPNGVRTDRLVYYPTTEELGEDEMRIISCGTGMPTARESQAAACFLVELGNGDKFIFDLGTGSHARLASLDIPYDYLNKVFLSHLHADHFGDFTAMYIGGWVGGRMVPFKVWGPSGKDVITPAGLDPLNKTCDPDDPAVENCDYLYGTEYSLTMWQQALTWDIASRAGRFPSLGGTLEIHEFDHAATYHAGDTAMFPAKARPVYFDDVDNDGTEDPEDVVIRAWPAVHAIDGPVSYSLEWNGFKFVFSGDTFPNKWFDTYAKDADIAIHECFLTVEQLMEKYGFTEDQAVDIGTQVHTSPQAFGYVMSRINPKLAVAYHFFNDFDTTGDIYDLIRTAYTGELSMADDFMVWNLKKTGDPENPVEITTRLVVYDPDVWPPEASPLSVPDTPSLEKSPWLLDGKLEKPTEPPPTARRSASSR